MKIQAKDAPFFNELLDEWHGKFKQGDQTHFQQYLKIHYDIEITQGTTYLWALEYFIFDSELDYFLTVMKFQ